MDFNTILNEILGLDLEQFKEYVQSKIEENAQFLEHVFWLPDGSQKMLLNALIQHHSEPEEGQERDYLTKDLTPMIDHILSLSPNVNAGEPVHQAIAEGKIQLALHLLHADNEELEPSDSEQVNTNVFTQLRKAKSKFARVKSEVNYFDVDKRDLRGQRLLALALESKNIALLISVLVRSPDIHAPSFRTALDILYQPIHQAIELDFADAVRLLAESGAQLTNPVGTVMDTPVILAARKGRLNALEALLERPVKDLSLEAENNHLSEEMPTGHTAIEEFCVQFKSSSSPDALRGVAMLLCRGAEPPRNEAMRGLLSSNRVALLQEIEKYLEYKPELVNEFVNRCHLRESALHNIVYANHSWGSSMRHLFGTPSESAFIVERLISNANKLNTESDISSLTTHGKQNLATEKDELKLYAEFVRRYQQAYDSQLFTNRWSTMRWLIAEGNCDWRTVLEYSKSHPTSRTRLILNEMLAPRQSVHESLDTAEVHEVQATM